jgi:hypothetical protein
LNAHLKKIDKELILLEYIKLHFDLKPAVIQNHVHEVQGCSKTADGHYHRFLAVTGEAIPVNQKDHIHEVSFRTDFMNGHYHEFIGRTSGTIKIGDRHIHYIEAFTTSDAGHKHGFRLVTFINDGCGE